MKFPAINISHKQPVEEEDFLVYMLEDGLLRTKKEAIYQEYFLNHFFCDSEGKIFELVDQIIPKSTWKTKLNLPNAYKAELVFKDTGRTMELETLRQFILTRLELATPSDFIAFYKDYVQNKASNWEELIAGNSET